MFRGYLQLHETEFQGRILLFAAERASKWHWIDIFSFSFLSSKFFPYHVQFGEITSVKFVSMKSALFAAFLPAKWTFYFNNSEMKTFEHRPSSSVHVTSNWQKLHRILNRSVNLWGKDGKMFVAFTCILHCSIGQYFKHPKYGIWAFESKWKWSSVEMFSNSCITRTAAGAWSCLWPRDERSQFQNHSSSISEPKDS